MLLKANADLLLEVALKKRKLFEKYERHVPRHCVASSGLVLEDDC